MKALIILVIFATLGIIFFQYRRNKNLKKLFIALLTFGVIISLAVLGNVTRQVMPIYLAHMMLTVVSWGGLILYLVRDRYYGWIIFSPLVTIGLFLLLEWLTGSGHEVG
jgi:predicted neutral ceramidase superfamily lipid hydrolase